VQIRRSAPRLILFCDCEHLLLHERIREEEHYARIVTNRNCM
jgi:hypothetical protein